MRSFDLPVLFAAALFPLPAFSELKEQLCYYAKDRLGPPDFIPCYHAHALDSETNQPWRHQACCKAGDVCLKFGACKNEYTGLIYHYGCTDRNYEDEWCARKCYLNPDRSNWVSLVFCPESSSWICHHPETCAKHCPKHTTWHPFLEKLPPIRCGDIIPSRLVGPTTEVEHPMTASPLPTHFTLPANHDKVREYLSNKGTSTRAPPPPPPPPPSTSPPPPTRPSPSHSSPPPPPPPSRPSSPPSEPTESPSSEPTESPSSVSPEPPYGSPSSAESVVSQSSEPETSDSISPSTNATSQISSPQSITSVVVTSSTPTEIGTEKPSTEPPQPKKKNIGVTVGATVGSIAGVAALFGLLLLVGKHLRKNKADPPLKGKQISDPQPIDDQPDTGYDSIGPADAFIPTQGELGSPKHMQSPAPGSAISTAGGYGVPAEVAELESPPPMTAFPGAGDPPEHASFGHSVEPSVGPSAHTSGVHTGSSVYSPLGVNQIQSSHEENGERRGSSGVRILPGDYTGEVSRTASLRSSRCPPITTSKDGGGLAPAGVLPQKRTTATTFMNAISPHPDTKTHSRGQSIGEVLSSQSRTHSQGMSLKEGLSSPESRYSSQALQPPHEGSPEFTFSPGLVSSGPVSATDHSQPPRLPELFSPVSPEAATTMPTADYERSGYPVDSVKGTQMPRSHPIADDEPSGPIEQTFELSASSSRELRPGEGNLERSDSNRSVLSNLTKRLGLS